MSQLIVCRNTEGAHLKAKANETWNLIKQLDFKQICHSSVKECSLLVPSKQGESGSSSPAVSELKTIKLEDVEYRDFPHGEASMSPFTCAVAVGSLRHVTYKDGAEFVYRIVEISDLQRMISYELIEADATVNVSSVLHTIQVFDITESGESMINWTTEFSGDCDQHVYSDCKFKKLDAFQDIRQVLQKQRTRE